MVTLPAGRVTISGTSCPVLMLFSHRLSTELPFNPHSSRSGSVQRIVSEVLRLNRFVMPPAFCAGALQIQCSSLSPLAPSGVFIRAIVMPAVRLIEIQFTRSGRVHGPLVFLVAYTGTQAGGRISLHFAGNVTDPTSFVPRSITITRTCCTSSLST